MDYRPNRLQDSVYPVLCRVYTQGFRFVRVDFYNINGKIYFGELTLYPGNGWEEFEPLDWDYKLGEWINLNQK